MQNADTATWWALIRKSLLGSELSVGCEACHGPAGNHIDARLEDKYKTIVNPATLPFRAASDVCGQCHTRGKSPDKKWDFPVGYKVGDYLGPQHFVIAEKAESCVVAQRSRKAAPAAIPRMEREPARQSRNRLRHLSQRSRGQDQIRHHDEPQ